MNAEPTGAAEALEQIKAMYAVEEKIRDAELIGDAKQLHRLAHSKPPVELFFECDRRQFWLHPVWWTLPLGHRGHLLEVYRTRNHVKAPKR